MVSEFSNTIFSHKFFHKCPGLGLNIGVSEFIIVNRMGMSVGVPGIGIGVWECIDKFFTSAHQSSTLG